ncbi:MAG: 2-oxoacid:acceptor oxidoreductase subunit alpha [Phycisphaerales bacterium]|nr:2-oxoacid:acceptor oxidoreductase subunit alpha [Phycisphaerales bacterium]
MVSDAASSSTPTHQDLQSVAIRFCGDSGDGMQFAGTEFTNTSVMFGNEVVTFPDYPAEIRAPLGTTYGVSGFQIQFSSSEIYTPGDNVQVLIAMNPAGLKVNIEDVEPGGIVIVNKDAFTPGNVKKAGYTDNPLKDGSLAHYHVCKVPVTRLTKESLVDSGMGGKAIGQAKNMFMLGLVYWLYDRSLEQTIRALTEFFGEKKKKPRVAEMNVAALKAGYFFGETAELFPVRYRVSRAKQEPGTYRKIAGNQATALGLITAAQLAKKPLFYGSYPITPASDILHALSTYKHFGVKTVQLEDEIAAMCSLIGASFAGDIAVTATSGPGMALKTEAIGLGVIMELPMVIVNVQRAGPSTGLPTKTEQSDLLQAVHGRNAETPLIVLAARGPGDCFTTAIESVRLALKYMTPVVMLTDGYIANGAGPWRIPDPADLLPIEVAHPTERNHEIDGKPVYAPYLRDEHLARPWALPGTPGLEHRIGGLEKMDVSGDVSYDAENHQHMVDARAAKIAKAADDFPPIELNGRDTGDVLLVGWGGTFGAIYTAAQRLVDEGHRVTSIHLRHLNPLPNGLGDILRGFKKVVVPELNRGQLRMLLRAEYLVDAIGINKVQGRPFLVSELVDRVKEILSED